MKYMLFLIFTMFGVNVYAQPVYRCVDHFGQRAFGGLPCAQAAGNGGANPIQAGDLALQRPSNMRVSFEAPIEVQSESNHQQLQQQDLRAATELNAGKLQTRVMQKPFADRKAAGYADNSRRCQSAMRVAALCGKFAGMFSCDEKGFRPASLMDVGTPKAPAVSKRSSFKMERCAQQATHGG